MAGSGTQRKSCLYGLHCDFVAVGQAGSIAKAAELVNVSPPTISA